MTSLMDLHSSFQSAWPVISANFSAFLPLSFTLHRPPADQPNIHIASHASYFTPSQHSRKSDKIYCTSTPIALPHQRSGYLRQSLSQPPSPLVNHLFIRLTILRRSDLHTLPSRHFEFFTYSSTTASIIIAYSIATVIHSRVTDNGIVNRRIARRRQ